MTIKVDYNGVNIPLYPNIDFQRAVILEDNEQKVYSKFRTLVPLQRDGVWYAVLCDDKKVTNTDNVLTEYNHLINFNKHALMVMEKYIVSEFSDYSPHIKLSNLVLSTIKDTVDMDGGDYDFIKKTLNNK
jgi:hypothetical protein